MKLGFTCACVLFAACTPSPATNDAGADSAPVEASSDAFAEASTCTSNQDFSADPLNCGACGHDCLGGACQQGVCQALVISNAFEPTPNGIVADATGAYWVDQGTPYTSYTDGMVRRLANDTTTVTTLVPNQHAPVAMAEDGVNVFFVTIGTITNNQPVGDGQMLVCPITGCPNTPTIWMNSVTSPQSVLRAGNYVYWTGSGKTWVASTTAQGSQSGVFLQAVTPSLMAADATYLYTSNGDGVDRTPLLGGQTQTFAASVNLPTSIGFIAVDATTFYAFRRATTNDPYTLDSCPSAGCLGGLMPMQVDGAPLSTVDALAADGKRIYWAHVASYGTDLKACDPKACTSQLLTTAGPASKCQSPSIAVSDVAVYMLCRGQGDYSGEVIRIAK